MGSTLFMLSTTFFLVGRVTGFLKELMELLELEL